MSQSSEFLSQIIDRKMVWYLFEWKYLWSLDFSL